MNIFYLDKCPEKAARLMTLMNLFQDKEEYEKCAIIKKHMNKINKILRKYK